jgi:hypothetical protein
MDEERYTLETLHQIWNDKTGDHIEIGPDRDGLDLIEFRSYTSDSHKPAQEVTLTREQLIKLQAAIGLILN